MESEYAWFSWISKWKEKKLNGNKFFVCFLRFVVIFALIKDINFLSYVQDLIFTVNICEMWNGLDCEIKCTCI